MKRILLPAALLLGALSALVLSTRRNLSEPHLRLFDEMVKSPASKSQTDNSVLPGGMTQQAAPPGTFARGGPSAFTAAPALSLDGLERGRLSYSHYCLHCHGAKGRGDGAVAKYFPALSF